MKRVHFWKTVFLTLGVVFILAISAFGIASLLAPISMMEFTASIGLNSISGDYAYQEYERSESIEYLARSFIIAADSGRDRTAENRFTILYGREDFGDYCTSKDASVDTDGLEGFTFRGYVCGLAARVRYRLASSPEDADMVIAFAVSETDESFPQGNPVIALTLEAVTAQDSAFCSRLLLGLKEGSFDAENADYLKMINILEGAINE